MTEQYAVIGGIAQLGERLHGMQEVIGSIPFTSTNKLSESIVEKIFLAGPQSLLSEVPRF